MVVDYAGVRNTVSASGWAGALAILIAWVLHRCCGLDMPADVTTALGVVITPFTALLTHLPPPQNGK